MKKLMFIPAIILFACASVFAQNDKNQKQKTIEVKGSAEMEIIPDEIYLRIALKEYKDGSRKIDINQLESGLVSAIKKVGIPKDNLQVDNIYGYNWDYKKKRSEEFLATKSFIVKLKDVKEINNLIEQLDPEGVNSSSINKYSHSKIEEYNKELKIKALKAAKDKAMYLLESIGEKLGGVSEIQEIEYGYQPVHRMANVAYAQEARESGYQSNLDFKTITIKSEIRAVFLIQ